MNAATSSGEGLGVVIRQAHLDDMRSIVTLHSRTVAVGYQAIFPPGPPPTPATLEPGWRSLLDRDEVVVLVAEISSGQVVGTVVLEPEDQGVWLKRLHVDPDHWGGGVGSILHDQAIATAHHRGYETLNLWVLERNDRARRMYERRSWTLVPGRTLANDPPSVVDVLYRRILGQT